MNGFKLICCQCGSDIILEKSGKSTIDSAGGRIKLGEGIQRKCINCSNESFVIFKTWLQKS